MKKILIMLAAALLAGAAQAQSHAVVSLDKMNVLYAGVDNPVSVAWPGYAPADLRLVAPDGFTVSPVEGKAGSFKVRPAKAPAQDDTLGCTLQVEAMVNGKAKRLGQFHYRVLRIPDPGIAVNGYKDGAHVFVSTLRGDVNVVATRSPHFEFALPRGSLKILSIAWTTNYEKYSGVHTAKGNILHDDDLQLTAPGERLTVTARVQMPDGTVRNVPCTLTLKGGKNLRPVLDEEGNHIKNADGELFYFERVHLPEPEEEEDVLYEDEED